MNEYTVPGPAGDFTVQLSDEEAKARGLTASESKAKAPANKQASPANKGGKGPSARQAAAAGEAFGAEKSEG
jgi:hypothetical protein